MIRCVDSLSGSAESAGWRPQFTAGDTVEETESLMREAIALYLEGLRAAGEPIPEPTSVARTVEVVGLTVVGIRQRG